MWKRNFKIKKLVKVHVQGNRFWSSDIYKDIIIAYEIIWDKARLPKCYPVNRYIISLSGLPSSQCGQKGANSAEKTSRVFQFYWTILWHAASGDAPRHIQTGMSEALKISGENCMVNLLILFLITWSVNNVAVNKMGMQIIDTLCNM